MPRPIVTVPDESLRRVASPVQDFAAVPDLARDMLEAMYAAPGRGLAAPQVGVGLRLFVMDPGWKEGRPEPRVLVNPEVTWSSPETEVAEEGCLSIPGRTSRVRRPVAVRLRFQDEGGAPREEGFDGFAARCAQHEIDHLDGVLCIDREEPAGEGAA